MSGIPNNDQGSVPFPDIVPFAETVKFVAWFRFIMMRSKSRKFPTVIYPQVNLPDSYVRPQNA